MELQSKVRLPVAQGELTKAVKGTDEYVPRRFMVKKEDLEKYGYTVGRPGRRAINRGLPTTGHTGECRTRLEKALEEDEDDRVKTEVQIRGVREGQERRAGG